MLTVYSKPNCPFCDKAKNYLRNNNIDYEVVDISVNEEARNFLLNEGHRSVPQIYNNRTVFIENGWLGLEKLTKEEILSRM